MVKNNTAKIISIDIGSTYTKGILISLDTDKPKIKAHYTTPTITRDLLPGFNTVLNKLAKGQVPVQFSSSAKGGLAIAAIGIVPDLTLKAAQLTAASAGGKIIKTIAYELTDETIRQLLSLCPDIILLTGGTDGGNKKYNLNNAKKLAGSELDSIIIYAGNNKVADEIKTILSNKSCYVTENVMPVIGTFKPEPARETIRNVFLHKITHGKGLTKIIDKTGKQPTPTPLSVFNLAAVLPRQDDNFNDILLIDMGGATTDVYSHTRGTPEEQVKIKGLPEPTLKRTVEGDLGMRVSAKSLYETGKELIHSELGKNKMNLDDFAGYISFISKKYDYIPASNLHEQYDQILAKACLYHALKRHCGTWQETFTPQGTMYIQQGKDLRPIRSILCTGGYLAQQKDSSLVPDVLKMLHNDSAEIILLPKDPDIYIDQHYIIPLIGNIVDCYPNQACNLLIQSLYKMPAHE